jgi:hypothetical protein
MTVHLNHRYTINILLMLRSVDKRDVFVWYYIVGSGNLEISLVELMGFQIILDT